MAIHFTVRISPEEGKRTKETFSSLQSGDGKRAIEGTVTEVLLYEILEEQKKQTRNLDMIAIQIASIADKIIHNP